MATLFTSILLIAGCGGVIPVSTPTPELPPATTADTGGRPPSPTPVPPPSPSQPTAPPSLPAAIPLTIAWQEVIGSGAEYTSASGQAFGADGTLRYVRWELIPENMVESGVRVMDFGEEPHVVVNCGDFLDLGDVTGDGTSDSLCATRPSSIELLPTSSWTLPIVDRPPPQSVPLQSREVHPCGDLNLDGVDDLCTERGVDLGPIDGVYDELWPYPIGSLTVLVDFDGDGRGQVVGWSQVNGDSQLTRNGQDPWAMGPRIPWVVHEPSGDTLVLLDRATHEVYLIRDTDWGTALVPQFTLPTPATGGYGTYSGFKGASAGDFDGDGEPELVIPQDLDLVFVELDGTVMGVRTAPSEYLGINPEVQGLWAGDHDHDGIDDLLVEGNHTQGSVYLSLNPLGAVPPSP